MTRQDKESALKNESLFVEVVYEAAHGYCRQCRRYQKVLPLQIIEQHTATPL